MCVTIFRLTLILVTFLWVTSTLQYAIRVQYIKQDVHCTFLSALHIFQDNVFFMKLPMCDNIVADKLPFRDM